MPPASSQTSQSSPKEEDSSQDSSSDQESALESVRIGTDTSSQSDGKQTGSEEEQEISISNTHAKKRKLSEAQEGPTDRGEAILSHAERRRQKRREEQNHKQSSKKARGEKPLGGDISTTSSTKRQNSVWVGNLAFKTTVEDLKSFFAGTGEITRVNMPTKAPPAPTRKPENRGYAYVDFSTPEGKAAAIALTEQPLTGRKLLIKDGDDFTGRPKAAVSDDSGQTPRKTLSKTAQRILKAQKQPPGPTLFLGNLGFETTEANIVEMLDAHRNSAALKKHRQTDNGTDMNVASSNNPWIRKVRMGTFEDSGLCKGFAFVDFVSTEYATSVLINPKNYSLNGRKLVVEYAGPDAVRRGMPKIKQVNKPRERTGKAPAPQVAQNDNDTNATVDHDTEEHPPKRQRIDKVANTEAQPQRRRDSKTHNGSKHRPKPGAALAYAQRESVAIIPSQGKKIKFD